MQFTDAVAVAGTRLLADGYLVAEARAVRTGIQLYTGAEVGRPEMPVVRVYRGPEEVFAQDSLQSFSHAPITMDHPAAPVTADNWKELARGEVSTAAKKDGEWVMLPLVLKDAAAIKAVIDGKRELSAGYTCELDFTPGTTADGQAFDAQQKGIKVNHLALVDKARAGSQARIGDGAAWGAAPIHDSDNQGERQMADKPLKTVTVDGLSIETTDQGAQVIEKLQRQLSDSTANIAKLTGDHTTALAAKDGELAKKDAEIDTLKGKILNTAALDALVRSRGDLIAKAKAIAPDVVTDGKAEADIRRAVVVAKLGDAAIADKPAAYIDARFDILAESVKASDPVRDALNSGLITSADELKPVNDARAKMLADMTSAHLATAN